MRKAFTIIKTLPSLDCSSETRSDFWVIFFFAFQLPKSRSGTLILGFSHEVGGYYCPDSFIQKLCCSFKVGINLKFSTAIITLGIHYNRGFTSSKILKRTYQNSYLTDHEKNNNNYKKIKCDTFLLFYSLQPCSRVWTFDNSISHFLRGNPPGMRLFHKKSFQVAPTTAWAV